MTFCEIQMTNCEYQMTFCEFGMTFCEKTYDKLLILNMTNILTYLIMIW
ncbi:hypothetical protein [Cetobacterium somerae]